MNGLLMAAVYYEIINCSNCTHSAGAGGASSGGGGLAPTVPSSHHVMRQRNSTRLIQGHNGQLLLPLHLLPLLVVIVFSTTEHRSLIEHRLRKLQNMQISFEGSLCLEV